MDSTQKLLKLKSCLIHIISTCVRFHAEITRLSMKEVEKQIIGYFQLVLSVRRFYEFGRCRPLARTSLFPMYVIGQSIHPQFYYRDPLSYIEMLNISARNV